MEILTLNKIAACGLEKLDPAKYSITDDASANADGIILRSFAMHDMELGDNLKAVARAGAGVNNIPIDKCTDKGIVVFNTPGANANAVKELAIAALLMASRDIVGSIEWAKTLPGNCDDVAKAVEKGKGQFAGCEIKGKTLGVIGLGAIGAMVAEAALALGMKVIGFDSFLSVDAAWRLPADVKKAADIKDIYANADYITLHVPLNDSTRNMISTDEFAVMKKGAKIINLARAGLVDVDALKAAIADGTVSSYVVDFPDETTIGVDKVVAIPHLGASTEESEDNCAMMAAKQLADYLEKGNIVNSVNFPNCSMPRETPVRLTILHKNVPDMLSKFSKAVAEYGINIEHMLNKSRKDNAYTIMDLVGECGQEVADKIAAIDGVLGVRIIK